MRGPFRHEFVLVLTIFLLAGAGRALADPAAVATLREIAADGDVNARRMLGDLYRTGQGVSQDMEEATRWYRFAASGGDAEAQLELGVLYLNGGSVKRDHVQALVWFNLAADGGSAGAATLHQLIAMHMTPAQLDLAARQAKLCRSSDYADCSVSRGR